MSSNVHAMPFAHPIQIMCNHAFYGFTENVLKTQSLLCYYIPKQSGLARENVVYTSRAIQQALFSLLQFK